MLCIFIHHPTNLEAPRGYVENLTDLMFVSGYRISQVEPYKDVNRTVIASTTDKIEQWINQHNEVDPYPQFYNTKTAWFKRHQKLLNKEYHDR